MLIRPLLNNLIFKNKILLFFLFITLININIVNTEENITVIKIYPPKCTVLKDSATLLCPRIMEIEVKIIKNTKTNYLISCIILSEEEEILAFGENYLSYPGGKIYLTIREMRRKINEMKLIAKSKCQIIN